MASKGRSVTQKVFTDKVEEAAETMPLGQALAVAGSQAGVDEKRLSPAMREELGFESEEARKLFEKLALQFATGTHPIQERARLAGDLKVELDATKAGLGVLKDQFVVKKEHVTHADEEIEKRSDHELAYFAKHGKWPAILDGDNSGPETVN